MTRIAFTADLHIDDFGSKVDPETGLNARFVDGLNMARWIAEDAESRECDVLIVGGDFTEQRHPAPWRVAKIAEALDAFKAGPFVFARGNHDGIRAGLSIADVLGDMLPEASGFSRPGITWVKRTAICVLPFLDRSWLRTQPGFEAVPETEIYRALGEQFVAMARGLYAQAHVEHPDLDDVVLVLHQGLAGGHMSDLQQAFLGDLSLVVDTSALASIGFNAILAGHFHLHQVLRTDPLVVYAGAPLRTDFGEEHQEKGYLVVDTEQLPAFEFVPTPARRFVTLRYEGLPEGGLLSSQEAVEGAIVRVLDLDPDVDTADIRRRLEAAGAFEITAIRQRPVEAVIPSGGLSEALTPAEALRSYYDGHDDAEALVDRGTAILQEVA